jgi:hypothetical protein
LQLQRSRTRYVEINTWVTVSTPAVMRCSFFWNSRARTYTLKSNVTITSYSKFLSQRRTLTDTSKVPVLKTLVTSFIVRVQGIELDCVDQNHM